MNINNDSVNEMFPGVDINCNLKSILTFEEIFKLDQYNAFGKTLVHFSDSVKNILVDKYAFTAMSCSAPQGSVLLPQKRPRPIIFDPFNKKTWL